MGDNYFYADLGSSYVCETCGPEYNELQIEPDDGEWFATYTVGCYSGWGARGRSEIIRKLESEAQHADNEKTRLTFERAIEWIGTKDETPPEHVCDTGHFSRTICPEPCGMMHYYCTECGEPQDRCYWFELEIQEGVPQ